VHESGASGIPLRSLGIMREESDFVADARSSSNAFGLMQIIVRRRRGSHGERLALRRGMSQEPKVSVALVSVCSAAACFVCGQPDARHRAYNAEVARLAVG